MAGKKWSMHVAVERSEIKVKHIYYREIKDNKTNRLYSIYFTALFQDNQEGVILVVCSCYGRACRVYSQL